MLDLPDPWGHYARIQDELSKSTRVSPHSWGLEAALDRILENPSDATQTNDEAVERTRASAARRKRNQHKLAQRYLAHEESANPSDLIEARSEIAAVESQVSASDWTLLRSLGAGFTYDEISATGLGAPGALRVRVQRLRANLAKSRLARDGLITLYSGNKVPVIAKAA